MSSPTLFTILTNKLIKAKEAVTQGVKVGEDSISGLMFANDVVGTSEIPEGLQKQVEKV